MNTWRLRFWFTLCCCASWAGCAEDPRGADPPGPQTETSGAPAIDSGRAQAGNTPAAGSAAGVANAQAGSMAGAAAASGAGSGSHAGHAGAAAGSGGTAANQAGSSAGAAGAAGGAGGAAGASTPAAGSGALDSITIWIAGDSTVANGSTPCPIGWGAEFQSHFSAKAKVVNSAVGGRSVRTWLYNVQTSMDSDGECVLARDASGAPTVQARWQQMLDGMKRGDYLFIQFGINDSSATCDRHVGLSAFKQSYGVMAKAAKERGAQAIFLTPVSSISCQGTTARGTRGAFVTATQEAGQEYGVPVIDLHARSVELYTSLGFCPIPGGADVSASTGGEVGAFFCDDHTHFERAGAAQIGGLIVQALRDQQIGLAAYLQ